MTVTVGNFHRMIGYMFTQVFSVFRGRLRCVATIEQSIAPMKLMLA